MLHRALLSARACPQRSVGASQASAIRRRRATEGMPMLWALLALVLILWLVGFTANVAGGLIHILLVVALVVLIFNLVSGRRSGL